MWSKVKGYDVPYARDVIRRYRIIKGIKTSDYLSLLYNLCGQSLENTKGIELAKKKLKQLESELGEEHVQKVKQAQFKTRVQGKVMPDKYKQP